MEKQVKKLAKIIDTHGLNKSFIAKSIGISVSAFANKIRETNDTYNFTEAEIEAIKKYLFNLKKSIEKL